MDDPIFHLSGIVKTRGEMQDFDGPLALILQLLSKNKIEIKDISISLILEQYLAYLGTLSDMNLEIASEFVAMASYLVLIKTKMLLAGTEEVEELGDLISSLEELRRRDSYAQIKAVTGPLGEMASKLGVLMVKPPEYLPPDHTYKYQHDIADLISAFRRLTETGDAALLNPGRPFAYPKRITYPVGEKVNQIMHQLKTGGAARMSELMDGAQSRSEVVAVFIAVLELCRNGAIEMVGSDENVTFCLAAPRSEADVSDEPSEE